MINEIKKPINVGIGFITGRKSFKNVVKTYIHNWNECGLTKNMRVNLNLFVAYDLKYTNTKVSDYTCTDEELSDMVNAIYYMSSKSIYNEAESLVNKKVITQQEAEMIFGEGYAMKRNAILYTAIKNHMDYLLFLDDDEYPVACVKTDNGLIWKGQNILSTHLRYIKNADITHGHHCGYISPIPYVEFNQQLSESDFRMFIEAISNDIISWDSIQAKMSDGGATYADPLLMSSGNCSDVPEINGAKFISGGNLCINLAHPHLVQPFYNPPGARGEDTFLSTCLSKHIVKKVPCYAFHDGFAIYNHLLYGVLPSRLKYIKADKDTVINRFYLACIGWIRYKPLLLYITSRGTYEEKIEKMRNNLYKTIPKICKYFGKSEFKKIPIELNIYDSQVRKHFNEFENTKRIWKKLMSYLNNYRAADFSEEQKCVIQ